MKITVYLLIFAIQYICGQNIEQNTEFIEMDSVLINGFLNFKSDTSTLYKILGKPNSIEVPDYENICASYFEKNFNYLHYKGSEFELYKDKVICRSINFQENPTLEFKTPTLILNGNTTVEDLKNYFPVAVNKISEINVVELGKVLSIGLPISKIPTDEKWILFVRDGILIRIDYWIPC